MVINSHEFKTLILHPKAGSPDFFVSKNIESRTQMFQTNIITDHNAIVLELQLKKKERRLKFLETRWNRNQMKYDIFKSNLEKWRFDLLLNQAKTIDEELAGLTTRFYHV